VKIAVCGPAIKNKKKAPGGDVVNAVKSSASSCLVPEAQMDELNIDEAKPELSRPKPMCGNLCLVPGLP